MRLILYFWRFISALRSIYRHLNTGYHDIISIVNSIRCVSEHFIRESPSRLPGCGKREICNSAHCHSGGGAFSVYGIMERKRGGVEVRIKASAGSEIYSAVPFDGIVNRLISLPSSSKRAFFRWIPPPYPVRLPFAPITR